MSDGSDIRWTEDALRALKFRGPVRHHTYAQGGARHDYVAVDEPRFGYFWKRENRHDHGRQAYMVDGDEVADLAEAVRILALTPSPESQDEKMKACLAELDGSPRLNYGCTHAISESRTVYRAGPFGLVKAWNDRSGGAYHQGINVYADRQRATGADTPWWLYLGNTAAFETSRGMLLLRNDREEDTGLKCALGQSCRTCPILACIETQMSEAGQEPEDIDAAKVWTCVSHILRAGPDFVDGKFFTRKNDESWI